MLYMRETFRIPTLIPFLRSVKGQFSLYNQQEVRVKCPMIRLFLLRHAESEANVGHILAGQRDFPLSSQGKLDAEGLAVSFAGQYQIQIIHCSPLLRAVQTAAPFVTRCDAPLVLDPRILEQHLGRFSGMTYAQAEADPGYQADRKKRWDWTPEGGGESYSGISFRVKDFLTSLFVRPETRVLVVTHAVTLRLFRAILEGTLPAYPESIPGNGELWSCHWDGSPTAVHSLSLGSGPRKHGE